MFNRSLPVPPKVSQYFVDTGSCQDSQGDAVNVTAVVSGGQLTLSCLLPLRPNVGLDWVLNNVTIHSTNSTEEINNVTYTKITLSDSNFAQEDVGLYRCVASNLDATHDVCSVDVGLSKSQSESDREGETERR